MSPWTALTCSPEEENTISTVDPARDALYNLDRVQQKDLIEKVKPWKQAPEHFKDVRISSLALLKMVTHARSGGSIEIMGIMLGSIQGDSFIVTDAFRLPVEGTETRVNAQEEANEYQVNYLEKLRQAGRDEVPVGWYHSHPGYGCWLSGIDVQTQAQQQAYQEPSVAVVIDPERTMSGGRVDIGAFRTYPPTHAHSKKAGRGGGGGGGGGGGDTIVPEEKAGDFGLHAEKYYALEVSYFKSSLDTQLLANLRSRYWVQTLTTNSLATNNEFSNRQIMDLAAKIKMSGKAEQANHQRQYGVGASGDVEDAELEKIVRMSEKIEMQHRFGLVAGALKDQIFTPRPADKLDISDAMKEGEEL
jgi:COP9 signalosome complex subunit 5